MSIPRYVARFIKIPPEVRKQLEKEYYRLVWDDKARTIKDLHAYHQKHVGGLRCFDLSTIGDALAVTIVGRALESPDLPWVHLTKDLLIDLVGGPCRFIVEALDSPWT